MAGGGRPRLLTSIVLAALVVAGCATSDTAARPGATARPADRSPAPVVVDGLTSLATSSADGFALHTASGDLTFLTGVNLGSTTPTFQPGELAISAADYRRWFATMGDLGVPAVRVYTIHPPAFYAELAAYNEAHPSTPIYLVQGVYLPDESYLDDGTLYDDVTDSGFAAELVDASGAVHGDLEREPRRGHASGTWTVDVSAWLAAWIIGVEWDPQATVRTDERHADAPATHGRYFRSTPEATATERWIARHMDSLAELEAQRGDSVPIAFANWPTVDPLAHPDEPLESEDLVGVDANHVLATTAWPGGTFASYHAYPYYPDFLRHEAALAQTRWEGRSDPYAGYLRALQDHHARAGLPVLVTEVGVPSSLGSAHLGTNGRDQGNHGEREAMEIDAGLLRLVREQGLSGAIVFAWTDEWFKRTWNTMEHQVPAERRQLWHDPLTNEQYFGVVATDSDRVPGARQRVSGSGPTIRDVVLDADASYVYLDVGLDGPQPPPRLQIDVDAVPGPQAADYRVAIDLVERAAQVWVRAELDPIRLDTADREVWALGEDPWHPYRLLLNRPLVVDGVALPAELQDVGVLVEGTWDPQQDDYDSLATWQVVQDGGDRVVRLRLPWPMVGLGDPSSRTALGEGTPPTEVGVDGLGFSVQVPGDTLDARLTWEPWQSIGYDERLKPGAEALAAEFAAALAGDLSETAG